MQYEPPDIGPGATNLRGLVLGFDTETYLFPQAVIKTKNGEKRLMRNRIPRLVCSSWSGIDDTVPAPLVALAAQGRAIIKRKVNGTWTAITDRLGTADVLLWTDDVGATLVGQNLPYDFALCAHAFRARPGRPAPRSAAGRDALTVAFRALAQNRVADTYVREKLLAIAEGWLERDPETGRPTGFSLADIARRRLGIVMAKGDDTWRLRFRELDGVPIAEWPAAAQNYVLDDAEYALLSALAQAPIGAPTYTDQQDPITTAHGGVWDESRQMRKFWALYLQSAWGVRTNRQKVDAWADLIESNLEEARAGLIRIGVMRANGSKDMKRMKALVEADYVSRGLEVPMTDGTERTAPTPSTSGDALLGCATPELKAWGEAAVWSTYQQTFLPAARLGLDGILPYNYDPIKATGRTSTYGTSIQNPPRDGGFRACIEPRAGNLFCSTDYTAAELCALGQIHWWVFGRSALRDTVNAGIDPHAPLAAYLAGVSLDTMIGWLNKTLGTPEEQKRAKEVYRQAAKGGNFGLPGGMGASKLVDYCLNMNIDLYEVAVAAGDATATSSAREQRFIAEEYARKIKAAFETAFPEAPEYMALIGDAVDGYGSTFTFRQFVSGRNRAACGYTDGNNTGFQGLVIDGASAALFRLAVMCYLPPEAALEILLDPSGEQDVVRWSELDAAGVRAAAEALYGVRPVLFVHDEVIAEGPRETAHIWGPAQAAVMREGMRVCIRDVTVSCDPALMDHWSKGAATVLVDAPDEPARFGIPEKKRLVLWTPK